MQYLVYLAVTIELTDFLLALLILCGAVALIALTMLLIRAAQTVKETNNLLKANRTALTDTIRQLPVLLEKVDVIIEDISLITEQAGDTIPAILEDVEAVSGTAADVVETVGSATIGIVDSVQSFFSRKSKRKSPRSTLQQVIAAVNAVKRMSAILKKAGGKKKTKKKTKKNRKDKKTFF